MTLGTETLSHSQKNRSHLKEHTFHRNIYKIAHCLVFYFIGQTTWNFVTQPNFRLPVFPPKCPWAACSLLLKSKSRSICQAEANLLGKQAESKTISRYFANQKYILHDFEETSIPLSLLGLNQNTWPMNEGSKMEREQCLAFKVRASSRVFSF